MPAMKLRRLGKTGWDVSAVSMGGWALSGQWGVVSERQAVATVHAALDAGGNLFDTADSSARAGANAAAADAEIDRKQVAAVAAICPPAA